MSRTDKHMPWWVLADWYEPDHASRCEYRIPASWFHRWYGKQKCNLPDRPVRQRSQFVHTRGLSVCTWEPVWPVWRQGRYLYVRSVPRWYVRHIWWDRERTRERDKLREMAKEYNSNAKVDDGDFPNWQHRHCATWYWD